LNDVSPEAFLLVDENLPDKLANIFSQQLDQGSDAKP